MINTEDGAARIIRFLPDQELPPISLLELTGDSAKVDVGWFPSGLMRRVAKAWQTPMIDLSCGDCRLLVGQDLGIRWLAKPVATFVARYPQAECDLYPGDLSVVAILAWREFSDYAPEATHAMLAQDFRWLRREAEDDAWDGSIAKKAVVALDEALRS